MKPRLCNPVECRASFRILRIRIIRKICTTLRTSWNWSFAFLFVSTRNRDTKYGSIASRSITLRPPLKNFHLSGEALNLNKYSRVNHEMHTASTIASCGLSWKFPFSSFTCILGMVLRVNAIVESTIKSIDITAITWKSDESTDQTKLINRELPHLRIKHFPLFIFFFLCPSLSNLSKYFVIRGRSDNKNTGVDYTWSVRATSKSQTCIVPRGRGIVTVQVVIVSHSVIGVWLANEIADVIENYSKFAKSYNCSHLTNLE